MSDFFGGVLQAKFQTYFCFALFLIFLVDRFKIKMDFIGLNRCIDKYLQFRRIINLRVQYFEVF